MGIYISTECNMSINYMGRMMNTRTSCGIVKWCGFGLPINDMRMMCIYCQPLLFSIGFGMSLNTKSFK